VETVEHGPELLAVHDTTTLQRMHDALRQAIPGDPSFLAAVSAVLRSLLTREIANPDRVKRDDEAAKRDIEAKAELLKAKQEAEKKALADRALTPDEKAKEEADALERRHQQELARLEHDKATADLAAKQTEERKEFEARQAEERGKLTVRPVDEPAGSRADPYPDGAPLKHDPYAPPAREPYPPAHV
jgi:hypothetical protein